MRPWLAGGSRAAGLQLVAGKKKKKKKKSKDQGGIALRRGPTQRLVPILRTLFARQGVDAEIYEGTL